MRNAAESDWISRRAEVVDAIRSGLFTGREVMERLGISAAELGGWCRAEQTRRSRRGASPKEFAEVSLVGEPPRPASAVVLLRGGRRVRVSPGFDAAEVVRLVRALESC